MLHEARRVDHHFLKPRVQPGHGWRYESGGLRPVIVTDRGQPSYVLLSYHDLKALTGRTETVASLLAMPQAADIELEPARMGEAFRPSHIRLTLLLDSNVIFNLHQSAP